MIKHFGKISRYPYDLIFYKYSDIRFDMNIDNSTIHFKMLSNIKLMHKRQLTELSNWTVNSKVLVFSVTVRVLNEFSSNVFVFSVRVCHDQRPQLPGHRAARRALLRASVTPWGK